MSDRDIVTFGIPLMASWVAQDWGRIVHQLEATLGSIYRQSDPHFRIILVGTDRPELSIPVDERFEFIATDQIKPMNRHSRMMDGVRKAKMAAQQLRELGGGYLMLTDGDDLISNRLVEFVRRDGNPNGYLVRDGYMFDAGLGQLSQFPFPDSPAAQRFDQECGTSAVLYLTPDELPARADDNENRYCHLMAEGHPGVILHAMAEGRPLMDLPFRPVVYVRNTGENISTQAAFSNELERIPFQANLDDRVAAHHVARTSELEAEFGLAAAEAAAKSAPMVRRFEPTIGLSVLISTHRRPAGLRRLLTALRPQVERRKDREITVVNDGSHDEDYAAVAREFADIIRYVALERNQGIAHARNTGLAQCDGTYAVFIDDDCVPPAWWLDWLGAHLKMYPEIDVLAGTTIPRWGRKDFRERLVGAWFIPRPWRVGHRDIFVTANVAIRASLARNVGGFGFSGFDGAGEDTELSLRLHRSGARFMVDRAWAVEHDLDATVHSLVRKHRKFGRANATISRLAGVEIPPPAHAGTVALRTAGLPSRVGARQHMASEFEGGRMARARAILIGAWIERSYLAGFRAAGASR